MMELAEESKADYLITGDKKHLLPLKYWRKTIIISPSDFIKIVMRLNERQAVQYRSFTDKEIETWLKKDKLPEK